MNNTLSTITKIFKSLTISLVIATILTMVVYTIGILGASFIFLEWNTQIEWFIVRLIFIVIGTLTTIVVTAVVFENE